MYVVATLVLTWPLARGLAHDIPADFGDPVFNIWVLLWDLNHLGPGWWNANIFHPHPLALAYSEHLLPQAIAIAPLYFVTHNPILCYNVLVLATFVLSGLGMYLLARELTGVPIAALVAGFAYAFTPYRISSLPHLQVLSSEWLPFALYGVRRYFASGRIRPLAGATGAWFLQNLSCGYYLLFLSPLVALYALWEVMSRRLWNDARMVGRFVAASAAVLAATAWFIQPYAELRRLGFGPRELTEVQYYSADVYAYATADPNLRLSALIAHAWPHPEGYLFPGLTIVTLSIAAIAMSWRRARKVPVEPPASAGVERASRVLAWMLAAAAALVGYLLLGFEIRTPVLRIASFSRHAWIATAVALALLAISRPARRTARGWLASPAACFSLLTVFAVVMSFGPAITAKGDFVTHTNLYAAFYYYAPGFDGVRVPARFAAAVGLGLAALSALAISGLARERRSAAAAIACVLIAAEAAALPIPINQNSIGYRHAGLKPLPASIATVPDVYKTLAAIPRSPVLVELPLGEAAFDIRYMYYSSLRWWRLVNGYSGGAPADYELLDQILERADAGAGGGDRAWEALARIGTTHAIVHEGFYTNGRGARLSNWLRSHGAREVAAAGDDHLFQLP